MADTKANPIEEENVKAIIAAEEADEGNQLSGAKIAKRRKAREANPHLGGNQVKGQYIPNPDYKAACGGLSGYHWGVVIGLFFVAYCFLIAFFFALVEIQKAVGAPANWFFFGFFLVFLGCVGTAVAIGNREKWLKEQEQEEEMKAMV